MIKLRDLIKEFVPGTMLDARKKPGDYWKGAITDTWYARSPEYGWRNSFDTEEEAKMWAEEGKDLEGYDEETAEHPPEPIEEFINEGKPLFIKNNKEISKIIRSSKKGDIFTVWAKGPATFKDEVGVFQNVGMMTDFGSKRRLPAFQELGSAGKPKELYITGIRKITIGDTIGKSTND